jgi:hypothetical protein
MYKWILIKVGTSDYIGWSKSIKEPICNDSVNLKWVEWNKPLPDDIDSVQYKYGKGKLKKSK